MSGRIELEGLVGLVVVDDTTNAKTTIIDTAGNIVGPAGTISYAEIQDGTGLSVIGRSANTAGVNADIVGTNGQVLRVSGTSLGFGTIVAAGIASDAVTTVKILDANVTYAKIANGAGTSIVGKATTGAGVNADITGTDGQVLRVNGTTVGFGTIATAGIAANAVTSAQLDVSTIQYVSVNISSAQILALFTTPVQVIASQGATNSIEYLGGEFIYKHVATDYTINGSTNLALQLTNASGATESTTLATTGFIDQATNQLRIVKQVATNYTPVANAPLMLTCATANPTVGDGTLTLKLAYRVHANT